jgi:uncharacterized membrane protein YfhO
VRYKDQFFDFKKDSLATINLVEYAPNKLVYRSNSSIDQLAVFSEIFYDKGWNAYIDGKLTPHMRANYVLRAMKIPEGDHEIVFKFEPKVWKLGNTVSLTGSILFTLLILGSIYYYYKKENAEA